MKPKDIHIGRTYDCFCAEVDARVRATVNAFELMYGDIHTYKIKCSKRTCLRGNPEACIMYATEMHSELRIENTLGNFPKKSKEV